MTTLSYGPCTTANAEMLPGFPSLDRPTSHKAATHFLPSFFFSVDERQHMIMLLEHYFLIAGLGDRRERWKRAAGPNPLARSPAFVPFGSRMTGQSASPPAALTPFSLLLKLLWHFWEKKWFIPIHFFFCQPSSLPPAPSAAEPFAATGTEASGGEVSLSLHRLSQSCRTRCAVVSFSGRYSKPHRPV